MSRKKTIVIAVLMVLVIGLLVVKSELLLTFNTKTNLLAPRFTTDGKHIVYVERVARGIVFGPGIEFFTPPAQLHVFSDIYALKEMDLNGQDTRTLFSWSIDRQQFWVPSYRNRLFGYPQITLDINGYAIELRCKLMEVHYPRSIEHKKQFWYNLAEMKTMDQEWFDAIKTPRPWHRNRISGHWEVMEYRGETIFLERFDGGVSEELRILRDERGGGSTSERLVNDLRYTRQRPKLEKLEATRLIRKQLEDAYVAEGMPANSAKIRVSDELEEMGLTPKSRRIVAIKITEPQDTSPVFVISDMEFTVGMFQDIDKAIVSPGKQVRYWGNYIHHRDFNTSRQLNAHLKTNREFQVQTSRGLYHMKIVN